MRDVTELRKRDRLLLSKDAIADVIEILKVHDFYRPVHATIFDVILDLYGRGEPADALMAEVANLEESLKKGEAEAQRLDEELTRRLEVLPNLPFDDVPDGTDETGNV